MLNASPINTAAVNGAGAVAEAGEPTGPVSASAFGFVATVFGSPAATVEAAGPVAASAAGFVATAFGSPTARVTDLPPAVNYAVAARPLRSTKFGEPQAGSSFAAEARAVPPSGAFGVATAGVALGAQPIGPTLSFGRAVATTAVRAAGVASTKFGMPLAGSSFLAASIRRGARFGVPSTDRDSAHFAGSIAEGARFGAPGALCAYRALHIPPEARFGKPLLSREGVC